MCTVQIPKELFRSAVPVKPHIHLLLAVPHQRTTVLVTHPCAAVSILGPTVSNHYVSYFMVSHHQLKVIMLLLFSTQQLHYNVLTTNTTTPPFFFFSIQRENAFSG